jgi:hypothetical protein
MLSFRVVFRLISLVLLAGAVSACKPDAPPHQLESVTSVLGSWQGRDGATIGFVSDSGRFRIRWSAKNENPPKSGRLHLTVHSAVSGRPLQEVLDHRGEGSGAVDFSDDPRSYNIMVDSANVDWSIAVDGISGVYRP